MLKILKMGQMVQKCLRGEGRGEFPENPEIVVFPKSEPSNQKFQAENQMKQLYLERLLSFVEILENALFPFVTGNTWKFILKLISRILLVY